MISSQRPKGAPQISGIIFFCKFQDGFDSSLYQNRHIVIIEKRHSNSEAARDAQKSVLLKLRFNIGALETMEYSTVESGKGRYDIP